MRIPAVLVLVAVSCCTLAGCATASPSGSTATTSGPAASAAPRSGAEAVDLAGTTWTVEGAQGATAGTTVHFDGASVTVSAGGDSSSYAWSAQGDQVLFGGSTSSLAGPVAATWLTTAAAVARTSAGWSLLTAGGSTTATLTSATTPSPAPTTATTLLRTAEPGTGVVDAPASTIEGTWTLDGDARTAITFSGGRWRAASSCTTGAVGGAGVYRVLPGGRLLVTRTLTPIRGCPIVDGVRTIRPNAITAIARAGSFKVTGDTLTLFDRAGVQLGSLVRG
jgi:hypothetical protein